MPGLMFRLADVDGLITEERRYFWSLTALSSALRRIATQAFRWHSGIFSGDALFS